MPRSSRKYAVRGSWAMRPARRPGWPRAQARNGSGGGRAQEAWGPGSIAATCSSCSGRYAPLPAPARLLPARPPRARGCQANFEGGQMPAARLRHPSL